MVKVSKKSSSSSADKAVVADVPPPLKSAAGKGKTKLRSCDMKKKKINNKNKDMEMEDDAPLELKDDALTLHILEDHVQNQIVPEDSKILYATNLRHPERRELVQADFEKFFRKFGKVEAEIQLDPKNHGIVDFAKIEFESHDLAKKAMVKKHGSMLHYSPVQLNGLPKFKGPGYYNTDCTNERLFISCYGFGKAIFGYTLRCELEKHFSSCGQVLRVHAPVDHDNGLSVGLAYIQFKDEKSLKRAFRLNGQPFLGSPLQVNRAKVFITSA